MDWAKAHGWLPHYVGLGVDYQFAVRVDGEELYRQEGMFTPFALDLTDVLKSESTQTRCCPVTLFCLIPVLASL